jgi:hypothetical protein
VVLEARLRWHFGACPNPPQPIRRCDLADQKLPSWRKTLFREVTGNIECSVKDTDDS